jgi:hypothetical protein
MGRPKSNKPPKKRAKKPRVHQPPRPTDGSVPLLNPKHEAFAVAVSRGASRSAAYREHVSDIAKDKSIWEDASRLFADAKVSPRIAHLRKLIDIATDTETICSIAELLQYHSRVVRSQSLSEPDDSDLIQERTYIEGKEETSVKVKLVSKSDSAKEIAKIKGAYAKEELSVSVPGLNELLATIIKPGIPREPVKK